jgi:hypothetical protein
MPLSVITILLIKMLARCRRYGERMGLNPFRAQAKRGTDVVIVVVALVVVAALVLWAVFG